MPTCSWGSCNSDSQYGAKSKSPRREMEGVKFFPFPKPKSRLERCKAWIKACGRKNFTVVHVTRNSYVCSKHFRDGKPTQTYPDPYPANVVGSTTQTLCAKRPPPKDRSLTGPSDTLKRRKILEASDANDAEQDELALITSLQTQVRLHNVYSYCRILKTNGLLTEFSILTLTRK